MKVAAFAGSNNAKVADISLQCTEFLFKELFNWCKKTTRTSEVNNSILVHLNLIKVSHMQFMVIIQVLFIFIIFCRVKIRNSNQHGILRDV